jgi:DNA invertase Pin-like site-specific DNA recombinase
VAEIYTDNDISAISSKRRPAYQRMLADIEAGARDGVIVWDLDRLHRKPVELEHFISLADRHTLALASVGENHDLSTDNGRLFARFKGAIAANEGERKSARQRAKNRQMAEAGTFSNVTNPFGWRGNDLDPAEADLIRRSIEALLKGASLVSVTADFNASGLKPPRAKAWSRITVRQTLTRPRNAAIVVLRGEEVGRAVWPPIVSQEVHRAVCSLLRDPARKTSPGNTRQLLLSGLLICGKCGVTGFTGASHQYKKGRRLLYRCNSCYGTVINRHLADEVVTEWVVAELSNDLNGLWVMANQDAMSEITRLRSRLAEIAEDEKALGSSGVSLNLLITQGRTWNAEREAIELSLQRLAQVDAMTSLVLDLVPTKRVSYRGQFEFRAGTMEAQLKNIAVVQQRFDALDLARRQTVIRALCDITILPSTGRRSEQAQRNRIVIAAK